MEKRYFCSYISSQNAGITTLKENDKVSYEEATNNGKIAADNIKLHDK